MSQAETDPILLEDEALPPEIQRRLQIEELWARRNVLAELMNAERLRIYSARRAQLWPAEVRSLDVPLKDSLIGTPVAIVPLRHGRAFAPGH